MLDAYAIRKAIPRIVFAVIAINLSIYVCVAMIDITNIVGKGINNLLVSPFVNPQSFEGIKLDNNVENGIVGVVGLGALAGITAGIFAAGLAGSVALGFLGILLPLLITVTLIAIAVMFTLVIRQGLLVFLTVVSPVAFVCNILPGTEKYFKQWFDLFVKTLVVYPIIAILFAMSDVLASILLYSSGKDANSASIFHHGMQFAQSQAETSDGIALVSLLVAIVVIYAPLALIPFAFKFAGGAISAVMNAASGKTGSWAGQLNKRINDSKQDPDSMLGKAAFRRRSERVERGLTGRQLYARATRGDVNSARSMDQKKVDAMKAESFMSKAFAADSDVQESLMMTQGQADQARKDLQDQIDGRNGHRATMARINQDFANGLITAPERDRLLNKEQNGINAAQRQIQAHNTADMIGRSDAARRNAFFSADRIKYSSNTHAEELAIGREIFGDEGIAEAMNKHQYVAKAQAGRPDLAGNLYGNAADLDKATESQSMYQLMNQGRPAAIESLAKQHMARVNDSSATDEQRARSAAFLHSLRNAKGQGTEANNTAVNKLADNIGIALDGGIDSSGRRIDGYHDNQAQKILATRGVAASREEKYQRTVTNPVNGEQTTTTETRAVPITDPLAEAKRQAMLETAQNSQAYSIPDQERDKTP